MDLFLLVFILITWIPNAIMVVWLAQEKNRSTGNWFVMAVFFGLVATLWLAGAPKLSSVPNPEKDRQETLEEQYRKNQYIQKKLQQ